MTIDGKITTKNFTPVDFTSRADKLHLWQQRAMGDAVVIGYSTLEHDNVRLGLPAELRQKRIHSGKNSCAIARDRFKLGQDRRSAKDFQVRPLTDPDFFNNANATKSSGSPWWQSYSAFEYVENCRSSRDGADARSKIPGEEDRLRGWCPPFPLIRGVRPHRPAQSHDRAVSVWRARCAYVDRLEQNLPRPERAFPSDQEARRGRGMLPDVSPEIH